MNERILRVLEFDKIIERLTSYAETTIGKELTKQVKPSINIEKVRQLQKETDEAVHVQRLNKTLPLGGIVDIRAGIKRAAIGGVLSTTECMDVSSTIYGGRRAKAFIENLEEDLPIIRSLVEQIAPLRELEQQINSCIDDHGHIMDSASEKLRGIRSSIRTLESRVRDRLDSFIKTQANKLSDAIITIRNDRYVLPVKQEYRGTIGGIVHDQSASGQTLFMEPKAVVDLNNQLQEATAKEKQEMNRILRDLSAQIANEEMHLEQNVLVLAKLDVMFARAKLGQSMKASMPKINNNGIINMKQARHPLIDQNQVVANDIEIGKDFTAIVITGPNTGGKTVTLKMVGLCTLMAQAGLQVPAQDGCELAVFKHVYADIGDEQSIEQNLSTFSSHMTTIVEILKHIDEETLVLFDELGAGTDPQEGAALAMAILDEVIHRQARVIATTHYPELKAYGYNRKQVVNASVEFDVQTLRPTYRLLLGVPGRSNAFEISKRLGLPDRLIEQAKSYIGIDSKSVENMIASLEKSQIDAEKEYKKAHELLVATENIHRDLQAAWDQWENKRELLYKRAEEKAAKAIEKAREEAEIIVEELRNMKTDAKWKEHEWIEAKKMLDAAEPKLTTQQTGNQRDKKQRQQELHPGDEVKLLTANQQGSVLEKINDKEYLVQVGIMKVKVNRKDLQYIGKQQEAYHQPITTIKGANYHVKTEIDLRGERVEDALLKLEKYIDDVLLAGYSRVSIIHGKGTGALRKGVQEYVKQHPRIADSRPGESGEGGSGVTVIRLK
ncbi:endonuclease MutS2 [Virgibacillus proomii]|uniref:endonuclease MutS2 n=1 Tax=Virgibacillus proomii TaxID=84407 RepID=UPI001C114E3D|nr:endonuclease MutS2 [Virgibacillus proomii]MBU5265637.1 endonuclease MutS2 [Virgibacillus proomii]